MAESLSCSQCLSQTLNSPLTLFDNCVISPRSPCSNNQLQLLSVSLLDSPDLLTPVLTLFHDSDKIHMVPLSEAGWDGFQQNLARPCLSPLPHFCEMYVFFIVCHVATRSMLGICKILMTKTSLLLSCYFLLLMSIMKRSSSLEMILSQRIGHVTKAYQIVSI